MMYDLEVTAEQLRAAAVWAEPGRAIAGFEGRADVAPVRLLADDSMLLAGQGDDRAAWDASGEPARDDYLAAAPLDPSPRARARALAEEISVIAGTPAEVEGGDHAAAQSALASRAAELAAVVLGAETPGAPTLGERAGPVGRSFAASLAQHVTEAIAGFPDSSPGQRAAIAQLAGGVIGAYAVQERGEG